MRLWLRCVLFFVVVVLLVVLVVAYHELCHQQISSNHGCVNSTLGLTWGYAYQECLNYTERSEAWQLQEAKLQSETEQITSLVMFPVLFMFTIWYAHKTIKEE